MRKFALLLSVALGACMQPISNETPTRAAQSASVLPPMKTFAVPQPVASTRSNVDIGRDFLDLAFKLESGRTLPVFTRFEGTVTVRVTGAPPRGLGRDLDRLMHRLRTEAQMDIRLTAAENANISIQAIPRSEIRRHLPMAACFVVPNIGDISEYQRARRTNRVNWGDLRRRQKLAIFVPSDASPQEMRDCLHEEMAQALGPLNDLYRLSDSVFNDDNVHTVLTGFDMLILRIHYHPDLRNGMSRPEVAARLPSILAQINPQGAGLPPNPQNATPRSWITAIQTALGPGTSPAQRRRAAETAVQIAAAQGWTGHRRAFSHYAMGRLSQAYNPSAARSEFMLADHFYARTPDTTLHRAYVASQLAVHALAAGKPDEVQSLVVPHLSTAARYENAALLSTLMMLRAEALELQGRGAEASSVRLDSLGWARYGFGGEWAVRAKLREIGSLSPLGQNRG